MFWTRSPVEVSCPTATRGFMRRRLLLAAVAAAAEARLAMRMKGVGRGPPGGVWRRRKERK